MQWLYLITYSLWVGEVLNEQHDIRIGIRDAHSADLRLQEDSYKNYSIAVIKPQPPMLSKPTRRERKAAWFSQYKADMLSLADERLISGHRLGYGTRFNLETGAIEAKWSAVVHAKPKTQVAMATAKTIRANSSGTSIVRNGKCIPSGFEETP